jgi:MoaA/NifB/PqqE/SkfB family radical SAM enzyme
VTKLLAALDALRGEEYRVVSISGGEPFAYRSLPELVHGARDLGYRVNLVTNGTLLRAGRLERLARSLSLVAVSLDGNEQHHNRVRGSGSAFADALRGMDLLRPAGIRFGAAMSVSRSTLVDVPDVYEVCRAHGAALLSLRPLAPLGRGTDLHDEVLTADELARLFVTTRLLDGIDDAVRVRTDVAPAEWIVSHPTPGPTADSKASPLAERVNPLVIDEAGALLPFAHGIHPRYSLGSVDDIRGALGRARSSPLRRLQRLIGSARDELAGGRGPAFVDWFARLVELSYATDRIPVVSA